MGMFDDVRWEYSHPLIEQYEEMESVDDYGTKVYYFQTKSLDRNMDLYLVDNDGRFLKRWDTGYFRDVLDEDGDPDLEYVRTEAGYDHLVDFTGPLALTGYKRYYVWIKDGRVADVVLQNPNELT